MSDAGPGSQQELRVPPGTRAPTAATREEERAARLRDPAHLNRLNAGLAAYQALPQEEKDRRRAENAAKKAAKLARRRAAEEAVAASTARVPDSVPPTVRSQRTPAPSPEIPHRSLLNPKTLLDLVAALPELGGGEVFIQVQRIKPTVAFNMPCAGVQKPLWSPTDDAGFQDIYGGAKYLLKGYRFDANGVAKPITDSVPYEVPGHPNIDSMLSEEDVMRPATHPLRSQAPNGRHPGLPAVAADAEIFKAQLEHNQEMDTRERADRDRVRRERSEGERRGRETELETAKLMREAHEAEMERMERLRNERGGGMGEMLQVLEKIRPGEDAAQLARQHSSEIKQLSESHKQEVLRITEQHREELMRQQVANQESIRRVEDNAREDRRRSEDLVRAAETRGADLAREAQTTADRRVNDVQVQARAQYEDLKTRGEERLRDQNEQWTRRFDDVKEAHRRELDAKVSEINLMRSNMEGNMQVLLGTKDTEIKRLQGELRIAKDEATNNKDWVGRMQEFNETAEAMGFEKGGSGEGADEDLKTTVIKAAISQLGKLPDMIRAGTDAIQAVRGIPPTPQQQMMQRGVPQQHRALPRGRAPAPVHLQAPLVFASEGDDFVPSPMVSEALPQIPVHSAMGTVPAMPPQPVAQQVFGMPMYDGPPAPPAALAPPPPQPQQEAHQAPPPAEVMVMAPAAAQAQALAAQPVAPVAPASAPPTDMDPMMVTILDTWAPILTDAFSAGATPEIVVSGIIAENPETMPLVRSAMKTANIDQVIRFLMQNPGPNQALLSRNGQKFLRGIWAQLEKSESAQQA